MYKVYKSDRKLACITLDYEKDYGDRINEFNILDQNVELDGLVSLKARARLLNLNHKS